jgi:hypothetical protein
MSAITYQRKIDYNFATFNRRRVANDERYEQISKPTRGQSVSWADVRFRQLGGALPKPVAQPILSVKLWNLKNQACKHAAQNRCKRSSIY